MTTNEAEAPAKEHWSKGPWRKIGTFEEWLALWEKAETFEEGMGLIHVILDGDRDHDPKAVRFLVELADRKATASHRSGAQYYHHETCRICLLQKKALHTLILRFVKDSERHDAGVPSWWWACQKDEDILSLILSFLVSDTHVRSEIRREPHRAIVEKFLEVWSKDDLDPHYDRDDQRVFPRMKKRHLVQLFRVFFEFDRADLVT